MFLISNNRERFSRGLPILPLDESGSEVRSVVVAVSLHVQQTCGMHCIDFLYLDDLKYFVFEYDSLTLGIADKFPKIRK